MKQFTLSLIAAGIATSYCMPANHLPQDLSLLHMHLDELQKMIKEDVTSQFVKNAQALLKLIAQKLAETDPDFQKTETTITNLDSSIHEFAQTLPLGANTPAINKILEQLTAIYETVENRKDEIKGSLPQKVKNIRDSISKFKKIPDPIKKVADAVKILDRIRTIQKHLGYFTDLSELLDETKELQSQLLKDLVPYQTQASKAYLNKIDSLLTAASAELAPALRDLLQQANLENPLSALQAQFNDLIAQEALPAKQRSQQENTIQKTQTTINTTAIALQKLLHTKPRTAAITDMNLYVRTLHKISKAHTALERAQYFIEQLEKINKYYKDKITLDAIIQILDIKE